MSNSIKFIVYGDPKGKARPRFKRMGKFTLTYTPKETVEYESSVRKSFLTTARKVNFKKLGGPVEVEVKSVFRIPKSLSRKKQEELLGQPVIKKQDMDNIIKLACDSVNGIAYEDDAQVCKVTGYKYYGLEPRIEVTIKQYKQAIQPFIFLDKDESINPIRFMK